MKAIPENQTGINFGEMKENEMSKDNIERKAVFTPVISGGSLPISELKKLVDVMENEGAEVVKLGGEVTFVWGNGGRPPEGIEDRAGFKKIDFRKGGVRPVRMCSAEIFCPRFNLPVLSLAKKIDERFGGEEMESKITIGVAGCQRSCSEPATKDIGIIASPNGYEIHIGGAAGMRPMLAKKVAVVDSQEKVLEIIARIVDFMRRNGDNTSRLGLILESQGSEELIKELVG